jgi:exopolyphosphatase/guanosine-5'-triphosphate,3'-diphosphate pyrophosphatase
VSSPERVAAIDVGSNTVLLLIAESQPPSGLRIIEEAEDQPRLGAGLGKSGRLGTESMERALRSIGRMLELCRSRGAGRIRAVATAAVREAENGEEFVRLVRRLGIELETIPPETEAALAYRSAIYHFAGSARTLVADIGGGSLELVGGVGRRNDLTRSLPLGAVRLTELSRTVPELRSQVRGVLGQALAASEWTGSQLIGSGGTFATAAAMTQIGQGSLPRASIQGTEIGREQMDELLRRLSGMSLGERRRVPGLSPERADIIVAGLVVAVELLDRVGASSVRVNAYGLREGLLLEMLGLDQPHRTTW